MFHAAAQSDRETRGEVDVDDGEYWSATGTSNGNGSRIAIRWTINAYLVPTSTVSDGSN
jgi:hypothetical protein